MISHDLLSKLIRSNPITDQLITRGRLLNEMIYHYRRFVRNFGRLGLKNNEKKFAADLRIRVHAIEKGLSLSNPRVGFGEEKVKTILEMVAYYKKNFNNDEFLDEVKSILHNYFDFQKSKNHVNNDLIEMFEGLFGEDTYNKELGGIKYLTKNDISKTISCDFEAFVESRCAIRDFCNTPVDINLIRNALKIAEKTPSACNRQPWSVYVYREKMKNEIFKWQHGSMGFYEEMDTAILVCCNIQSYFMGEVNLPYVDGGLYAMTLIYALHSQGLGTIPLTMGLGANNIKYLYKHFGIKDSEVPILLIGVGNLKDEFKVAKSNRFPYDSYTTFFQ